MTDVATDTDSNAKAYSVSELAFALKRTLEDAYGFVRLRGELSKVTHHSNGHVYLTIKDERAAIDGVVWKGSVKNLSIRPQQGMEVVVTGKITTYPAGSRYQMVIETMEAAGVGALLAQLERLKAKLHGEGLFEQARKRPLPTMPAVVGVITSPTGAVIRDILHRIRDRWPCRVIVWPVVVQGDAAAGQVANAIARFNAMAADGPVPRPDVLIVARGGGSVEDLWAFNDEALARAVAAGTIPLISAVGHETDTTLIDFVSDRRAPTPTAAAEMATPVLAELKAYIGDLSGRLHRCGGRTVEDRRGRVEHAGRALARVPDLVEMAAQRFNLASSRLGAGLSRNVAAHHTDLVRVSSRLSPGLLQRPQQVHADRLARLVLRLKPAMERGLDRTAERLSSLAKLYASVDPSAPLKRGFARVHRPDGSLVREGASLVSGEGVKLVFADQSREATIDGTPSAPPPPAVPSAAPKPARAPKPPPAPSNQGDLF
ncbi:exodeoxyribonuclease VII large subunit [Phenylobacterium haematophilum]|uniref:Exodeoxyribonuclease 7 large subunit n=1 Tax=Phenylobacterium haematophilum TaxID=98513 RepID=A0A839ZXG8_9CAUL|nr:exodeoxyribonuclease VII large subunit [Phenylobacterium haematophilum]MBB3891205.1 exodeoxyribonuclease VII large subunit [Phenylobacterium haematophilum]